MAKKDGDAWPKDSDKFDALLAGQVDESYVKMRPAWLLNDAKYFGKHFEPEEGDIYILVELPKAAVPASSLTSTSVKMDPGAAAQKALEAYEEAAQRLKDDPNVSQLVDAVRYVAKDTHPRPFIVLESSSGTGKTQMAFNLMARDDIELHYVVCKGNGGGAFRQKVHTAYEARSATFLECIQKDLNLGVGEGEVPRNPDSLELYTFEFVRALLTRANEMAPTRCSYKDARDVIQTRTKQPVIFLDEFPLLEQESDTVKLRFMRNVFRILRLPVIISSTNGTARNMVVWGKGSSRGDINVLWCVVVPEMPRFQQPTLETLPHKGIAKIVEHSRPLFACFALEHVQEHKLPVSGAHDKQIIDYMDNLACQLALACRRWKSPSSEMSSAVWFRVGQLCLFLSANYYKSTGVTSHLIHGHFARLKDPKMFELRFAYLSQFEKWELATTADGGLAGVQPHTDIIWRVHTVFPRVEDDVLLYLSLLGGANHHAFTCAQGQRVPFSTALREFDSSNPKFFDFSSPGQTSNDGMRLEAMTVAAMVSASHCNGFAGIPVDKFLWEMVYELGMQRPASAEDMCRLIPEQLRTRVVPFLAPHNTQWPDWLPRALKLGTLTQTKSEERIDFRIGDGWLTGECKDYSTPLTSAVMQKIIERIPSHSRVHVVVANTLQGKYFTGDPFEKYLAQLKARKPNPLDLMDTIFLQCGSDGVVRTIRGIHTQASQAWTAAATARKAASKARRASMSTATAWKRVVLFVVRELTETRPAELGMQEGVDKQQASHPRGKKRKS